jgi:hypothetical protein
MPTLENAIVPETPLPQEREVKIRTSDANRLRVISVESYPKVIISLDVDHMVCLSLHSFQLLNAIYSPSDARIFEKVSEKLRVLKFHGTNTIEIICPIGKF